MAIGANAGTSSSTQPRGSLRREAAGEYAMWKRRGTTAMRPPNHGRARAMREWPLCSFGIAERGHVISPP